MVISSQKRRHVRLDARSPPFSRPAKTTKGRIRVDMNSSLYPSYNHMAERRTRGDDGRSIFDRLSGKGADANEAAEAPKLRAGNRNESRKDAETEGPIKCAPLPSLRLFTIIRSLYLSSTLMPASPRSHFLLHLIIMVILSK